MSSMLCLTALTVSCSQARALSESIRSKRSPLCARFARTLKDTLRQGAGRRSANRSLLRS